MYREKVAYGLDIEVIEKEAGEAIKMHENL
jgi:hypothetical protein